MKLPHFGCPLVHGARQVGRWLMTDGWIPDVEIPPGLTFTAKTVDGDSRRYMTAQGTRSDPNGMAFLCLMEYITEDAAPPNNAQLLGLDEHYDVHTNTWILVSAPPLVMEDGTHD